MAMLCKNHCAELWVEECELEFAEYSRQAMEAQAQYARTMLEMQRRAAATGAVQYFELAWAHGDTTLKVVYPKDLRKEDEEVRTSRAKRARREAIASKAEVVVAPPDWTPLPTGCGCPSRA